MFRDSRPAWVASVPRVLSIYKEDIACLADGKLLNDSVIDCYLNYVYYEIIPAEFKAKTHIFSTCFNNFLMSSFEKKNRSDVQKSVLRWVKNVDIFSKDFIFVPINRSHHWYLAVFCFVTQVVKKSQDKKDSLGKIASAYSSDDEDVKYHHPYSKTGRPCILFFDSNTKPNIGKEKMSFASSLIQFFEMVWNSQNPKEPCDWSPIFCYNMTCPQQNNVSDCGLFLLQYVESFFKNPIPNIGGAMPMLDDWFPRFVIERKRMEVRAVLAKRVVERPQTANSCSSDVVILSS